MQTYLLIISQQKDVCSKAKERIQPPPMNASDFEMKSICALSQKDGQDYDHGKNPTGDFEEVIFFFFPWIVCTV